MVAIDTNIIIRLLTCDDKKQYSTSLKLFREEQIYIPDTVILETEWVLRFAYEFKPEEVCEALRKLFGLPNVYLANERLVAQAIDWHEKGLDFADSFHLALCQGIPTLKTFDEKFIKQSKKLSHCIVEKP
ncbi:MAG: PIN domain nuclease [Gammaproteobacteria bacterium]|nr:MAG: PIN domain nuclease [Gammaproteobacteria bacterium]